MLQWQILKDFIPSDHLCVFFQLIQLGLNRIEGCLAFILGAFVMTIVVKNMPTNAEYLRDADLIPGSGRSPGGRHSNSVQDSGLENPMDRGAWRATVHRIANSWTQLKQLHHHLIVLAR